jgi:hypothetical protein
MLQDKHTKKKKKKKKKEEKKFNPLIAAQQDSPVHKGSLTQLTHSLVCKRTQQLRRVLGYKHHGTGNRKIQSSMYMTHICVCGERMRSPASLALQDNVCVQFTGCCAVSSSAALRVHA